MTLHALLILTAACTVGAFVIWGVVASQMFGAVSLLIVFALHDGVRDNFALSTTMSGIRVSALDVLCGLMMLVGVWRAIVGGVGNRVRGLTLALVALVVFHIARGVFDFGLQTAVNSARTWIYFTAPLLFAATVPEPWTRRAWATIAGTGAVLAVVCVPYFLVDGLRTSSQYIYRNGLLTTARPVVAAGALLILEAAILVPAFAGRLRGRTVPLVAALTLVVVLVQHRTIWVAGLVAGLVAFVGWSKWRLHSSPSLVFGLSGAILLLVPAFAAAFVKTSVLVRSADETTATKSTWSWRVTGWRELVDSHHSVSQVLTGGPAGASWARDVSGIVATQSPHNSYVEAYLRFGAPGLIVLALILVAIWRQRGVVATHLGLTQTTVSLLLLVQLLFGITYQLTEISGLVLGMLISAIPVLEGAAGRVPVRSRPESGWPARLLDPAQ